MPGLQRGRGQEGPEEQRAGLLRVVWPWQVLSRVRPGVRPLLGSHSPPMTQQSQD